MLRSRTGVAGSSGVWSAVSSTGRSSYLTDSTGDGRWFVAAARGLRDQRGESDGSAVVQVRRDDLHADRQVVGGTRQRRHRRRQTDDTDESGPHGVVEVGALLAVHEVGARHEV